MTIYLIFVINLLQIISADQIEWQNDQFGFWSRGCDFKNNDIKNSMIQGQSCSQKCSNTDNCTHFVWTELNSGTCWLKSGIANLSDAVFTNDFSMVCGLLTKSIIVFRKCIL